MYNQTQPLGSSARGGGGGWKFLSFMDAMKKGQKTGPTSAPSSPGVAAALTSGDNDWAGKYNSMGSRLGLGVNLNIDELGSPNVFAHSQPDLQSMATQPNQARMKSY